MGKKPVREIFVTFPAEEEKLEEIRRYVGKICKEETSLPQKEMTGIQLAVEEACTNVIRHAYHYAKGDIGLKVVIRPTDISFSVIDKGRSFDFDKLDTPPDLQRYIKTGRKGGLGIFLIRKIMNEVGYNSTEDGNELKMVKYLEKPKRSKGKRRGMSIRVKFGLWGSLVMLLIVAGVYSYFSRQVATSLREKLFQDAIAVARNLASSSTDLLALGYDLEMAKLIKGTMGDDSNLVYALILDNEGVIWAHSDMQRILTQYRPSPGVDPSRLGDPQLFKDNEGRAIYDLALPIKLKGKKIGVVHVGLPQEAIIYKVAEARKGLFLIAILGLIVGFVAVYLLSNFFVKPIQKLTKGVLEIGNGDLESRIPVESNDEFGEIARAFNEITLKFKQAQKNVLEQERLQKEMQVAQEIQHTLLPSKFPQVDGYEISTIYRAAKEVGGDYFDFVWVDDDTLGIVVADVSGKGVPGSLVMTMIRTALRLEARGKKSAADVLAKVNNFVSDDVKKGMFVTIFYIILDSKRRVINYASAGHNPMILYRGETKSTYFLNPKGIPVGLDLLEENSFEKSIRKENIKLKKDDMLIIYTDGITEAMNRKKEQFGEERFSNLIREYGHYSPQAFVKRLDGELANFTGNAPQNDDITLVVIKEKEMADDVLLKERKRLMEMVESGIPVKVACDKSSVSPSTYYRYKKRMEKYGEMGLLDKVSRSAEVIKKVSLEDRNKILDIIREHPQFGAKRIAQELNTERYGFTKLDMARIYQELRSSRLNTKLKRLEFVKRTKGYLDERLKRELEREKERQERLPETAPQEEVEVEEATLQLKKEAMLSPEDIDLYGSILEELKKVTPQEKADKLVDNLKQKLLQRKGKAQKEEAEENWREELVEDSFEGEWQEEVGPLEVKHVKDPLSQERDWSEYAQKLKRKIKRNR
jgi:serine phosphatase RsbU (regulator of sigma subunit)/anti-sigma regulatory factor (Ser/Thr protein kinase)